MACDFSLLEGLKLESCGSFSGPSNGSSARSIYERIMNGHIEEHQAIHITTGRIVNITTGAYIYVRSKYGVNLAINRSIYKTINMATMVELAKWYDQCIAEGSFTQNVTKRRNNDYEDQDSKRRKIREDDSEDEDEYDYEDDFIDDSEQDSSFEDDKEYFPSDNEETNDEIGPMEIEFDTEVRPMETNDFSDEELLMSDDCISTDISDDDEFYYTVKY